MNKNRNIPQVAKLLELPEVKALVQTHSREAVVRAIRPYLQELRMADAVPPTNEIAAHLAAVLHSLSTIGLRRVINATGILVHTNLGRAVLGSGVLEAIQGSLSGYCDLEYDLATGNRGKRAVHVEAKVNHLAGCEASLAVNNNAAALMLAINTFALGKEVVVSRGELVEIGGSFRLPEIIERAGGTLREVGTTNKTKPNDYARAITKKTGIVLKIHTSNYRISGFTQEVGIRELIAIGQKMRVPVLHDAGSGLFVDSKAWRFENEPDPRESVRLGAALVCMSGDKLLGGPQAGIVLGKKKYIDAMKRNPMMRALRMGKLDLVALEAALIPFINPTGVFQAPLFTSYALSDPEVKRRAGALMRKIQQANPALQTSVVSAPASVGGGSQPGAEIPSYAVLVRHPALSPRQLAEKARSHTLPIIGDFIKGAFALNVRSLLKGEEREIAEWVRGLIPPNPPC
ncbi:MAG: L-seryl-tRNA(Sec) selenium transferase [Candidatus Raymondbacteria bacterium RifOxyA12_full_50_37]|uniref:L-seryl-tRNA(Sec) selenium transferase n=1 Tax=Candidatus Raymondbacteria bacterium RIFOXYD12_FULL_49_13 TaxID=1817890 RepID=A0A1F7F7X9_UNCRA|nr:MAG: L-seryl-tRNA(Sec) selenium transferase [Candidatus Raymondbacteria bacterium RifOxyA12_full_50_37]OGJ94357.1 MAG: L-seryl-tRNA(Sec) selenium transferase [Candidatus Raymondbacteria bacterium RIFOXYA2_FULL_49_16]OGJ95299.1 MAG: L-seryl-tRNA(Sec) selenium transferase [Candidatus Raymondbacteria bacterium RIFOXYC2_FULL_50_21]OGJ99814.1 MAG: L-seryl-tRNA(Sec) selenium transferase [Candidatus Raymondbacteria bacterium RifOxyC12_full_50_8]OGK02774.1 MAG: L-seryl-tRNA(Sec) selenium transferase